MFYIDKNDLKNELSFQFARSGGKGGQHVNKTETKVIAFFNIKDSNLFNENQKHLLLNKLKGRINSKNELIVESEEHRSQIKNKVEVITKILNLIESALIEPKPRKRSKPTKAVKEKRLKEKKRHSEKKQNRRFNC